MDGFGQAHGSTGLTPVGEPLKELTEPYRQSIQSVSEQASEEAVLLKLMPVKARQKQDVPGRAMANAVATIVQAPEVAKNGGLGKSKTHNSHASFNSSLPS